MAAMVSSGKSHLTEMGSLHLNSKLSIATIFHRVIHSEDVFLLQIQ